MDILATPLLVRLELQGSVRRCFDADWGQRAAERDLSNAREAGLADGSSGRCIDCGAGRSHA